MKSLSLSQENKWVHRCWLIKSKHCLLAALCTISYSLFPLLLQAQSLTPSAKVSLLTVSPGASIVDGSGFGHSAICISDPQLGIDKVYNYGTFDFRTGNFLLKFLRGTLPYQLSVSPMYYTIYGAELSNRSVDEQVLNLSINQKQKLYNFLENNYLPQNREYRYKFFYDNCSTRLRDALTAACGDSLVWYKQPILGTFEAKSYRGWMSQTAFDKKWANFGMNIAIGLPSDHICNPQEEMYLPLLLQLHVKRAKIGGKPLESSHAKLYAANNEINIADWTDRLFNPFTVSMFFMFLTQMISFSRRRNVVKFTFEKIILGFVGALGWFLFLLWVATDHGVTAWNLNLLWITPLHLPLVFFLGKPKHHHWVRWYVVISLILCVISCVLIFILGFLFNKTSSIPHESGLFIVGLMTLFYFILGKIRKG